VGLGNGLLQEQEKFEEPAGQDPCSSTAIPKSKAKMKSLGQASAALRGLTSAGKECFPAPEKGWEYHLPLGT